eukprot:scaffold109741_cov19-Tisochrysis_lutea.AAC.3
MHVQLLQKRSVRIVHPMKSRPQARPCKPPVTFKPPCNLQCRLTFPAAPGIEHVAVRQGHHLLRQGYR